MGKQCFTCSHKISKTLSKQERLELMESMGEKTLFRVPEMTFTCAISKKQIEQIDPACDQYSGDQLMEEIRSSLSGFAKKELRNLRSTGK